MEFLENRLQKFGGEEGREERGKEGGGGGA